MSQHTILKISKNEKIFRIEIHYHKRWIQVLTAVKIEIKMASTEIER